jgi:hypothetical protein
MQSEGFDGRHRSVSALGVARAHGAFNVASGLWPLLHMRSFERVLGPKADRWLVQTVAGMLVAIGAAQLSTRSSRDSLAQARRVGEGTAATLAAIDLRYAPNGRISMVYLVDAALEVGWLLAWQLADGRSPRRHRTKPGGPNPRGGTPGAMLSG